MKALIGGFATKGFKSDGGVKSTFKWSKDFESVKSLIKASSFSQISEWLSSLFYFKVLYDSIISMSHNFFWGGKNVSPEYSSVEDLMDALNV